MEKTIAPTLEEELEKNRDIMEPKHDVVSVEKDNSFLRQIDDGDWSEQDLRDYEAFRNARPNLILKDNETDNDDFAVNGKKLSYVDAIGELSPDEKRLMLDWQMDANGRLNTQAAFDYLLTARKWNDKINSTIAKYDKKVADATNEALQIQVENKRNDALALVGDYRSIRGGDDLSRAFALAEAVMRGDDRADDYGDAAASAMDELNRASLKYRESASYKMLAPEKRREYRGHEQNVLQMLHEAREYSMRPDELSSWEESKRAFGRFLMGQVVGLSGAVDMVSTATGGWYENSFGEAANALMKDRRELAPSKSSEDFMSKGYVVNAFVGGAASMGSIMAMGPVGMGLMTVQSAGETFSEAKSSLLHKNPNATNGEIFMKAGSEALLAGATTYFSEHLSELMGNGLVPGLGGKGKKILSAGYRGGWMPRLSAGAKGLSGEWLEEMVENNVQDVLKGVFRDESEIGQAFEKEGMKGVAQWEGALAAQSAIGVMTSFFSGMTDVDQLSGLSRAIGDSAWLADSGVRNEFVQECVRNSIGSAVAGQRGTSTGLQSALAEVAEGKARPGNPIVETYAVRNDMSFDDAASVLQPDAKVGADILNNLYNGTRAMGRQELLEYVSQNPLNPVKDSGAVNVTEQGNGWLVQLTHGGNLVGAAWIQDKAEALALQDLLTTSWQMADRGQLRAVANDESGNVSYLGKVDGKWCMFDASGKKLREFSQEETGRLETQIADETGKLPNSPELKGQNAHVGLAVGDKFLFNGRDISISAAGNGRGRRQLWTIRGTANDMEWIQKSCPSLRVVEAGGDAMTVEGANPRYQLSMAARRDGNISIGGHRIGLYYIGKDEGGQGKWGVLAPERELSWLTENGFAWAIEDGLPVIHGESLTAAVRNKIDPDGTMSEEDGFMNQDDADNYFALMSLLPGSGDQKDIVTYLRGLPRDERMAAIKFFGNEQPIKYTVTSYDEEYRPARRQVVSVRHEAVEDLVINQGVVPHTFGGKFFLAENEVDQAAYNYARWLMGDKEATTSGANRNGEAAAAADMMSGHKAEETAPLAESPVVEQKVGEEPAEQSGEEENKEQPPTKASNDEETISRDDIINAQIEGANEEIASLEAKSSLSDEDKQRLENLKVERRTLERLKSGETDDVSEEEPIEDSEEEEDVSKELKDTEEESAREEAENPPKAEEPQEEPKKVEQPKAEEPKKVEQPKAEEPKKVEQPKAEAPEEEQQAELKEPKTESRDMLVREIQSGNIDGVPVSSLFGSDSLIVSYYYVDKGDVVPGANRNVFRRSFNFSLQIKHVADLIKSFSLEKLNFESEPIAIDDKNKDEKLASLSSKAAEISSRQKKKFDMARGLIATMRLRPDGPENLAYHPNDEKVSGYLAVVDVRDIVVSGDKNADERFQPRKEGARRTAWIDTAAKDVHADQMITANVTDMGVPTVAVVNDTIQTIAGHGRMKMLRRMYKEVYNPEQYQNAVQNEAERQGIEYSKDVHYPVLVRVLNNVSENDLVKHAEWSNFQRSSAVTQGEAVATDARLLENGIGELLPLLHDSEDGVMSDENQPFRQKFFEKFGARNGDTDENGKATSRFEARLEKALLATLFNRFDKDRRLALITTLGDEEVMQARGVTRVVKGVLSNVVKMVKVNNTYPEFSIGDDLGRALEELVDYRANGGTAGPMVFIQTPNMFRGGISHEAQTLFLLLEAAKSQKQVSMMMSSYLNAVIDQNSADTMLFPMPTRSKDEILSDVATAHQVETIHVERVSDALQRALTEPLLTKEEIQNSGAASIDIDYALDYLDGDRENAVNQLGYFNVRKAIEDRDKMTAVSEEKKEGEAKPEKVETADAAKTKKKTTRLRAKKETPVEVKENSLLDDPEFLKHWNTLKEGLNVFSHGSNGVMNLNMTGLNAEQWRGVGMIVTGGAGMGYVLIKRGVTKVLDWMKTMREFLAPQLKQFGFDDDNIDSLLNDMWQAKFTDGDVRQPISAWAEHYATNGNIVSSASVNEPPKEEGEKEEPRYVQEGFKSEEELSLYDLLVKNDLSESDINRIKEVASRLLQKIKSRIAELDHWTEKQETKAVVDNLIRDTLWNELPEIYDENILPEYRKRIYEYVYARYKEIKEPVETHKEKKTPKVPDEDKNKQKDNSAKPKGSDYRIPKDDDNDIPFEEKARIEANIQAIELLKEIERENRQATDDEKRILARYTGWGKLGNAFDPHRGNPETVARVRSVLTDNEYSTAMHTTLDAFYTSRPIARAMWDFATKVGFNGGIVGEFGAGIGNFLGVRSEGNIKFKTVELDDISARLLNVLYPNNENIHGRLELTRMADDSLDMVIGNFPFGQTKMTDMTGRASEYGRQSIHNYFLLRALDAVKPGGYVIALTSHYAMDSSEKESRDKVAKKGDLVAAIRLPNSAFEHTGTSVVSDILIFRKKDGSYNGETFDGIDDIGGKVNVNRYFSELHPENVIGEMGTRTGRYGRELDVMYDSPREQLIADIEGKLREIALNSPKSSETLPPPPSVDSLVAGKEEGEIFEHDGEFYHVVGDAAELLPGTKDGKPLTEKQKRMVSSFLKLSDKYDELLSAMEGDSSDTMVKVLQNELEALYDKHVKEFNAIASTTHSILKGDSRYYGVAALEIVNKWRDIGSDGKMHEHTRIEKSDIFSKRTVIPIEEPTSAKDIADALEKSFVWRGGFDLNYMANLLGKDADAMRAELLSLDDYFVNPANGNVEHASDYLFGNIAEKLTLASDAANNEPSFKKNVEALEAVKPKEKTISEIGVTFGASYIPADVYNEFFKETYGVEVEFRYFKGSSSDTFSGTGFWKMVNLRKGTDIVNLNGVSLMDIAARAINLQDVTIFNEPLFKGDKRTVNRELTARAKDVVKELKQKFEAFCHNSSSAAEKVAAAYNEKLNVFRLKTYDSHIGGVYPGAAAEVNGKPFLLRDYQRHAVSRIIDGPVLLDHCVGAGKTATMITGAMELKRLGKAQKTMIVVQNSTIGQFASFARQLYPSAKVLHATKADFEGVKRKIMLSKIATGAWDIVIVPQSQFRRIPDSTSDINSILAEVEAAAKTALEEANGEQYTVQDIEKSLEGIRQKLVALTQKKSDNVRDFSHLGVDALFVDEAHNYKKNFFFTSMGRVKGLDRNASVSAMSLYIRMRGIQRRFGREGNTVLATGTPISNTLTELWNMVRFLSPDTLADYGVSSFDQFAAIFCETQSSFELDSAGRPKMVDRFSAYKNVDVMSRMYRTVADVVLSRDLKNVERPPIKGGGAKLVVTPRGEIVTQAMRYFKALYEWYEDLDGQEKREHSAIPLCIYGYAKKATVDLRLLDPRLPDDPDSKVNKMIGQALAIYRNPVIPKSAQVIFCDSKQYRKEGDSQTFSLFEDIKAKLVKNGVPSAEIAIIDEYNTDAAKAKLFAAVNDGDVRFIIGTTEKLGVGVNIQQRLQALHNLDAPLRPMDYEQRIGRIVRSGNMVPECEIYNYAIERTLDASSYQLLSIKQKFIEQAKLGEFESADDEDPMASGNFAQFLAEISGDPRLKQLVELEAKIKALSISRDNYFSEQQRIPNVIQQKADAISHAEAMVKTYEAYLASHQKPMWDAILLQLPNGEKVDGKRSDVVRRLDSELNALRGKSMQQKGFVLNGLLVKISTAFNDENRLIAEFGVNDGNGHIWINITKDLKRATDLVTMLSNRYNALSDTLKQQKDNIAGMQDEISSLKERLTKKFDQEDELKSMEEERVSLRDAVMSSASEERWTDQNMPNLSDFFQYDNQGGFSIDGTFDVDDGTTNDAEIMDDRDDDIDTRPADGAYSIDGVISDEAIEATLANFRKKFGNVGIELVSDDEQLPDDVLGKLKKSSNGWKGLYYNGTVYVNEANIDNQADLVTTLLHEIGVHHGLKQLFSTRIEYARFLDSMTDIPLVRSRVQKWLNSGYGRARAIEEVVAEVADKYNSSPIWKKILTTLSDMFRKMLDVLGIHVNLDETHIRDILKASVKAASRAAAEGEVSLGEPSFRLKEQIRGMAIKTLGEENTDKMLDVWNETPDKIKQYFSWGDSRGGVLPIINDTLRKALWELAARSDEYRYSTDAETKAGNNLKGKPYAADVYDAVVRYWNGQMTAENISLEVPHFNDDADVREYVAVKVRQRELLDNLSMDVASMQGISKSMRETIINNLTKYHYRAYRIHREDGYSPTHAVREAAVNRILSELRGGINALEALMNASTAALGEGYKERYEALQRMIDNVTTRREGMVERRSAALAERIAEIDHDIARLTTELEAAQNADERKSLKRKIGNRERHKTNLTARWNAKTQQYVNKRNAFIQQLVARRERWNWENIQPNMYLYLATNDEGILEGMPKAFVSRAHAFKAMLKRMEAHTNNAMSVLFEDGRISLKGDAGALLTTANGLVNRILEVNSMDNAMGLNLDMGAAYKIIQSSFIHRKDIPEEIRALLGEIKDVAKQFAMTSNRLSRIIVMSKMYDDLYEKAALKPGEKERDGYTFYPNAYGKYSIQLIGAKYGRLEGMFTNEQTKRMLDGYSHPAGPWMKLYTQGVAAMRYTKTVLNPTTHLRNFLGNIPFAVADGEFQRFPTWCKNFGRSWSILTGESEEARAERQKLMHMGLIGTSAHSQELVDIGRVLGLTESDFAAKTIHDTIKRISNALLGKVEFAYAIEDGLFKLAAYYNKIARGVSPGDAVRRIRDLYPTYDMAPVAVSEFSRYNPIVKDFIIFKAEALRCLWNSMKYAREDWRNGDYRSSTGVLLNLAVASQIAQVAIGAVIGAIADWDDDKEKMLQRGEVIAMRKLLPDYRTDNMLFPWRESNGEIAYIDVGYIYPFDYLPDMTSQMLKAIDDPMGTPARIGSSIKGELVGSMGLDLLATLYTGRDADDGREYHGLSGRLGYVAKAIAPSSLVYLSRGLDLLLSDSGEYTTYGGNKVTAATELAKTIQPFRISKLNLEYAYRYKMARLAKEAREYIGKANSAWRKYYEGKGLKSTAESEEAEAKAFFADEFADRIRDLESAGAVFISSDRRNELLKEAGFSEERRKSIISKSPIQYNRPEKKNK